MVILETAVKGVSAAQIQRFVRQAQKLAKIDGEVDVLISGNKRLQELNRRFRRKNKPTDVLSFPRPTGGDIAISAEIARENATRYGHATADELNILVLHGMLHLAGYDHESDNGRMARREAHLRARLKLPASLIDRTHAGQLKSHAAAKPTVRTAANSRKLKARKSRAARTSVSAISRRSPQ
ncbi:MAG: rRNA maturation RNase YbeY [Acidobacteriia bacterium]|nr:rRNA maturation RNase YbeY [Terriglobia bacterium]